MCLNIEYNVYLFLVCVASIYVDVYMASTVTHFKNIFLDLLFIEAKNKMGHLKTIFQSV